MTNAFLDDAIRSIKRDDSIDFSFITGSYVNGYYCADSDIDIVAASSLKAQTNPLAISPNISLHLVQPSLFSVYEAGIPYMHLRIVPIKGEGISMQISDTLKSELVRRQLLKFKQKEIRQFEVLDPIINYLYEYGIDRPWRIKPIRRIMKSEESRKILETEYKRIFDLFEDKGVIMRKGTRYSINQDFVFFENFPRETDSFKFKMKNSKFGLDYLTNLAGIIEFSLRKA